MPRPVRPEPARPRRSAPRRPRPETGAGRLFGDDEQPSSATVIYTDGACRGNPGPGGWAWAIPGGRWASGADPRTTNQRMEVTAVLEALRANEGPLEVWSDSTYVVNCFRDRWWQGWMRRGWRNSAGKPVANRNLWEPLIDLYLARAEELRFHWVKGHGVDPVNAFVDACAVEAARTLRGAAGTDAPELA